MISLLKYYNWAQCTTYGSNINLTYKYSSIIPLALTPHFELCQLFMTNFNWLEKLAVIANFLNHMEPKWKCNVLGGKDE